jgi:CheY-like chemotaxis protein
MNQGNNIDGIFHPNLNHDGNHNHDGDGIEKKEDLKPIFGLVIDDEEDVRELIKEGTEQTKGLTLRFFSSSDEALDQIKNMKVLPDFLVIDGNIKGSRLNGAELIDEIKKDVLAEKIPVIFTFTNDPNLKNRMLEKGANFSLDKDPDKIFTNTIALLSDAKKLREKIAEIKTVKYETAI